MMSQTRQKLTKPNGPTTRGQEWRVESSRLFPPRKAHATRGAIAWALVLFLCGLLVGCGTSSEPAEPPTTGEETKPKSAADGTYHGELMNARRRAMDSLQRTDAARKDLEREERAFERPASPTPKEEP
ncbi:MAG: hypothetical protein KatS3mg130_0234 [Candidatus Sumerlaea sp.]|uniref:Uncharacterized protein n=1 Tax=Sumerlaea chitinivorans TaxID=2250252 RepID=A0A2Z4Y7R5_SUMC1|nr:hypothetical protein BRCON_2555 [Candidatus Sumerlaea chitinivorans]GIX43826.1 MAG: hypothetical protein KatS3mg130_0234 [Candidatus Sumerlaea sp.]